MIDPDVHLQIGALLFEGIDQIDLTGPFEVLSRLRNSTYRIYGKSTAPVRDIRGFRLSADAILDEAPPLDILHMPGGFGQERLMDDEQILTWVHAQAAQARCVFSVCTGALICGAAGLLIGKKATTHWSCLHLLPYFGAIPVQERFVSDGNLLCAGGVTAGIDGALRLAADLRGEETAQLIQLHMQYAPEPPFDSGTPRTAAPAVLDRARHDVREITESRQKTAERISKLLGVQPPSPSMKRNHGALAAHVSTVGV